MLLSCRIAFILLLKTLRFLFAYNAWCVSAREIDLEKVRAALNATCLHCGASIPPDKQVRLDFERMKCPGCADVLTASAEERLIASGLLFRAGTMGKPIKRSLGQRVIQGCCSLLFVAGVLVFFQGVYGIVYGALLILLGVGVAIVGVKDPRTQDRS